MQRRFVFDCFCDLWPSEEYRLTMRTLPIDFQDQTLLGDSSVNIPFTSPGCSDKWDQHCKQSKEVQWKPKLLQVKQLFPDYRKLSVILNIAPLDYRFKVYVISLFRADTFSPVLHKEVYVTSDNFRDVMLDGLRVHVTNVTFTLDNDWATERYYAAILAKCPTHEPECDTVPFTSKDDPVTKLANPCTENPCGILGSCQATAGKFYICTCIEGALFNGTTCFNASIQQEPVESKDRAILISSISVMVVVAIGALIVYKYRQHHINRTDSSEIKSRYTCPTSDDGIHLSDLVDPEANPEEKGAFLDNTDHVEAGGAGGTPFETHDTSIGIDSGLGSSNTTGENQLSESTNLTLWRETCPEGHPN